MEVQPQDRHGVGDRAQANVTIQGTRQQGSVFDARLREVALTGTAAGAGPDAVVIALQLKVPAPAMSVHRSGQAAGHPAV